MAQRIHGERLFHARGGLEKRVFSHRFVFDFGRNSVSTGIIAFGWAVLRRHVPSSRDVIT